MDELRKLLGLKKDADEDAVLAAVKELCERAETAENAQTLLAAEQEAHAATQAALAQLQESQAAMVEAQRQQAEDALIKRALDEGRMRPGQEAIEKAIRTLAKTDLAAATEYVDGLPRIDPISGPAQAAPEEKRPANEHGMTEQQLQMAEQLGLTPEQWRAHNPRHEDAE